MRILIFGTGQFYRNRKDEIPKGTEIVGFLDNNSSLWGTQIDGVLVYPPSDAPMFDYDKIVLFSAKASEMKEQLLSLGIDRERIWHWVKFKGLIHKKEYCIYGEMSLPTEPGKNILIITQDLGYHGGAMAAVYVASVLRDRDYSVVLAAPSGDYRFIEEITKRGLTAVLSPALYYLSGNLEELKRFDMVLVNVFPMIQCACEISRIKPVLWWIHENSVKFENTYITFRQIYDEYDNTDQMDQLDAVAVSQIARRNFNFYYPDKIRNTLVFGIPDTGGAAGQRDKDKKTVFALIGSVMPRKGQDIFLESVRMLKAPLRERAEFWIIGSYGNDPYSQEIRDIAAELPQVKLTGTMTREEIMEAFQTIDVVVCASREETMSITVVEGMMYGKLCITTDATGVAEYIQDGENGFVCKAGDATDLAETMDYIIEHYEQLSYMKENARKTYETQFSMDKFGERLEKALQSTIERYAVE